MNPSRTGSVFLRFLTRIMTQGFSISDLAGWRLEASRPNHKCVWSLHAAHLTHSPRIHSPATRAHAFSIFPKILLLSTAMVSLRKDLYRSSHASVHASPPSHRPLENPGPLCDKAGFSRSTWGRTKKVRNSHLMTSSPASMRSLRMPTCSLSMFRVPIPLAYGALRCFSMNLLSPYRVSRRQWSATTGLASAFIAQCSPGAR